MPNASPQKSYVVFAKSFGEGLLLQTFAAPDRQAIAQTFQVVPQPAETRHKQDKTEEDLNQTKLRRHKTETRQPKVRAQGDRMGWDLLEIGKKPV